MKVFYPTLFILLSIEEILCLPTRVPKAIHLPLEFIKRRTIVKRSDSLESTVLNDADVSELAISVKIGTPAQEFTLLFDTGSSDTWVPSVDCSESNGCPTFLNHYDPSSSVSYQTLDQDMSITYLTGNATGTYFTDTFSLDEQYTIPSQTLTMMDSTVGMIPSQQETYNVIIDGVLGAGLPGGTIGSINGQSAYDTIPVALYNAGLIPQPVFSLAIGSSDTGKVVFGDIISDCSTKDFVYSPLAGNDSLSKWTIYSLGFELHDPSNTTHRTFKFNQYTPAAIDTGTNLMYLPTALAHELAHTIDPENARFNQGLFEVDCSHMESSTVFKSYFPDNHGNNLHITIPLSKLIAKRESDDVCFLLFTPSDNQLVFGNMFLRHFVTVFDFGATPQIGFAPFSRGEIEISLVN